MDTWQGTCTACDQTYKIQAHSKAEAIRSLKALHEEQAAKATAFRCDSGGMFNSAFNLSHPAHPCAPREW